MSLTDPLTSARNRRFFQATIASDVSQAIRAYSSPDPTRSRRNRDIIFYLIDADHFKEINDRFGHDAGDQMLIDLTTRISSAIRYSDVLVRWGGEEFLVVSRFCERKEAATLAARVLSAVAGEPFKIKGASGVSLHRTVSIGWAAFPWNMNSPVDVSYEEVLALADRAMYKAKTCWAQPGHRRSPSRIRRRAAHCRPSRRLRSSRLGNRSHRLLRHHLRPRNHFDHVGAALVYPGRAPPACAMQFPSHFHVNSAPCQSLSNT